MQLYFVSLSISNKESMQKPSKILARTYKAADCCDFGDIFINMQDILESCPYYMQAPSIWRRILSYKKRFSTTKKCQGWEDYIDEPYFMTVATIFSIDWRNKK